MNVAVLTVIVVDARLLLGLVGSKISGPSERVQ